MGRIEAWHESPFGIDKEGADHWENCGWGLYLLDESEGKEFLVWTSPYIVRAGEEFSRDILTVQTMLATGTRSDGKASLVDNDFVYSGWDVQDHLSSSEVKARVDGKTALWNFGHRTYLFDGSGWRVEGAHAGVELTLSLSPFGEAIWYLPPDRDPISTGEAWFWAFADARGSVKIGNSLYSVVGRGIHERHIIHGLRYMTEETGGRGFSWFLGLGGDYRFIISDFRGRGLEAHFVTPSSYVKASGDDITIDKTEQWVDPRSRFAVPSRWRLVVEADELYLNASLSAYLRAYYPWTFMKRANTVLYFFLTSIDGYYRIGGRNGEKRRMGGGDRGYVHMNWAFHQRKA